MNRDFITLTPEEEALIKKMEEKYPDMSFSLQAVSPARAGEVRRFMRDHLDDADAQRAALLSGGNWAGARLMNAALRDALIDWFIADYTRRGLNFPLMDRDANASFVDRRFADSHYETIHTQRDEARAELDTRRALDGQQTKNTQYLLATVDDLKLDLVMGRHNEQELLAKIDHILNTFPGEAPAPAKKKKDPAEGGPNVEQLSEDEILDKFHKRQERQEGEALDEAAEKVDSIVSFLIQQGAMHDPQRARSLVADVCRPYKDFGVMFRFGFKPYLDSKDFIIGKVTPMQLADLLKDGFQFERKLDPKSIKRYFYQWFDKYQSGEPDK